ncbi:MAG: radical SAM protein, partial [Ketobacteraceae bacterium]|nr:radical SAM protein [Ketobacteraceae bacterium]
MQYIEPVFRPPSEGRSLILQVTNGCSWNKCTFCEMYTQPQKKFRVKPAEELEQELIKLKPYAAQVRRVFLADGDAMTLSFRRLESILDLVHQYFPNVQRISSYCLPRNLKNKSVEQLARLREMGLSLMYVGCESGDDEVLGYVQKGETFASSLEALEKIRQAGMKSSVMILNGLGGDRFWEQHAVNSARLMNAAQPDYLSTLVVSFPLGVERFAEGFAG